MESYTPVPWEHREVIEEQIASAKSGKVFFFEDGSIVEEVSGRIIRMEERQEGVFIFFESGEDVRIDRIITLFGKPGAAYDEYDSYANACLDCLGGYTKEELDEL